MKIRLALAEDAPGIARVHVDSWRTTYKGLMPAGYLSGLSYERRANYWRNCLTGPGYEGYIFVAESAPGEIVGFSSSGPVDDQGTGFDGELYTVYLLEAYQRQGTGHRLVAAAVKRLVEAGYKSLVLWVLRENPARSFYAALGGATMTEISYGWDDINTFSMEAPDERHRSG